VAETATSQNASRLLARALAEFPGGVKSDLHRRTRRSLLDLQRANRELVQAFDRRLRGREERELESKARNLEAADVQVAATRDQLAKLRASAPGASADLIKLAETLVATAEAHRETVVTSSGAHWARRLNRVDAGLLEWHQELVAASVEALWDDTKRSVALNLFSVATFAGGALGAPPLAVAATMAEGAQLVAQLASRLRRATRRSGHDRDDARLEAAIVLIEAATGVTESWNQIVRDPGSRS
jgi:hypothetical protein